MRHLPIVLVPLLMALLQLPGAMAEEAQGLFQAQVPVVDQGDEARRQALAAALAETFVKVSGHRDVVNSPAVREAVAAPEPFVQQFRYRSDAGAAGGGSSQVLEVRFEPARVRHVLESAGLPVWGQARPGVLAWLMVERNGGRELLGGGEPDALVDAALRRAGQRGLPLVLPLLDLQERASLRPAELWAGGDQQLVAASDRYGPEGILVGRMEQGAQGDWLARWALWTAGVPQRWEARGADGASLVAAAVDAATDILASRFAPSTTAGDESGATVITVSGVASLRDYVRVRQYLEGLDAITGVQLQRLGTDVAVFRVVARTDMAAMAQQVGLGRVLQSVPGTEGNAFQLLP